MAKIEGFNDYYITKLGEVFSYKTNRILKPRYSNNSTTGYYKVVLYKNGKAYTKSIHRLLAEAFLPTWDKKLQVNHIDGNGLNNNLCNLEMVTAKENIRHAHHAGLCKPRKGSKHHNCKLSEDDIRDIKYNKENLTQRKLASKYNVSFQQINKIVNGLRWGHIN